MTSWAHNRSRATVRVLALALVLAAALSAVTAGAAFATPKPPKVTKSPANVTVNEGEPASFTSTASGEPTPTVQWEVSTNGGASWSNVEGATSGTLTIASAKVSENGYQFRAKFTNSTPPGVATSNAATLTVHAPPVVTKQPTSTTVEEGQNAVFEATASGAPAPTVQWQVSTNGGGSWANVAGATSTKLTLTAVKTTLSGNEYRAVFKNIVAPNGVESEPATLTVQKKPAVTKQPLSTTAEEGQTAVFEATASGFPAPTVQWEVSTDGGTTWANVEGATTSQLMVAVLSTSMDGNMYRATFTNAAGVVTSDAATLSVRNPPVVTQEPVSTTVEVGEEAVFEALATGFPAPTVHWEISTNGGVSWSAVEGATSTVLTVPHTVVGENGHEYRAVFTNSAGTTTSNAVTLTVATNHFSAVAWGQNVYRQLGDGSIVASSNVPVEVSGLRFVEAVAAGGRHSLALLADGTVVSWGSNEFGQLGIGEANATNVPVAVGGLSGVKAISAGADHSLALLANGTVMAWGDNESGQLGTGDTKESNVPVAVSGLKGVKAISAGSNYSLALLTNGTVMAWGGNEAGQLGTGNTKQSDVPVAVKSLTGVSAVSAGGDVSLALLAKGTVDSWGSNEHGQLGNTTAEEGSDVPVAVEGLTSATAVAAGAEHGLALLSGGTVMAWGADASGQVGNGAIAASVPTPVAVGGLAGVAGISAGGADSAALLASGSLMSWGNDAWGTLGDAATGSPSDVPVTVSGLTKAVAVSVGALHMLAYGEPIPTVSSVSPSLGPAAGGQAVTIKGTDLTGATAVKFGAAEATGVTVESSTTITATSPPGTGTVNVTVVTPSGTSPTTAADRYTYQLAPTVTKLSAKSGPVAGKTVVTITGTEFTGTSAVTFGSVSAEYTVNSPTTITAVAPAQSAGIVDVRVTNTSGPSAITTKDRFKYTPTVESVTPNGGPIAGGTPVTVTGTGFALGSATSFKFGKSKATAVSCESTTVCTMKAPAHAAGTVDVTAVVAGATSPLGEADHFTYS
jgi:alpha-tubulin suppressor-like RCC1 family protein